MLSGKFHYILLEPFPCVCNNKKKLARQLARKRGLGSFTVGLQMSTSLRVLSFYYNYNIQALRVLTILAPVGGLLTYPKGCYEQTEKVELSQPKHNQNSTKDGLDLINALHQPTQPPTRLYLVLTFLQISPK